MKPADDSYCVASLARARLSKKPANPQSFSGRQL